ncbi:mucin-2-like isoform X2 [Wyeomyia smithii]|uniref:mucin-2-like isoform X2 n=1 Tax=Wyeomyia smithii TaxID=174621 RepID=UPI002467BA3A|nr:mucin-2-like isoform X2 [Wyeomyia smithii]
MASGSKKMRRRSRMKVLKILQSFSQGTFIAFVLLLLYCGISLAEPGYLDFDNLPETNFTCAGKVIGGYYADLEASCQMFHVCTIGQGDEPMDIKFLCLNGTVFDQETRVCERVDEVDCSKSERFYYLNLELYGNTVIPAPEESSSEDTSSSASNPSSTTSTTSTTTTTTTRRPTTTTPSRRYIFNNSKGTSVGPSSTPTAPNHSYPSSTQKSPEDDEEYEYEDDYEDKSVGNPSLPTAQDDGSFSPQQFTLHQQNQPKPQDAVKPGSKPAVSFQQQHFQNGGTLAVTNSHVTVTTHTTSTNGTSNPKKNSQQFNLTQKEKVILEHQKAQQQQAYLQQQMHAKQHEELQRKQQEAAVQQQQKAIQQQQKQVQQHESEIKNHQALLILHQQKITRQQQKQMPSTTRPPIYNPYVTINPQQQQHAQAPKRIPLLAAEIPLEPPEHSPQQPPSAAQLAPFRLRAQGFKLPSQQRPEQEDRFEGYRRQLPPQVSLHLPFEQLRHQKDISLQFDPDVEDLTQIPQHKELKRSDPPLHSSIHGNHAPPVVSTTISASPTLKSSESKPAISVTPEPANASFQDDPVEYDYEEDYSSEAAADTPAKNPSLDSVKSNTNSEIVVASKRSGENQLSVHTVSAGGGTSSKTSTPSSSSSSSSNSSKGKTNTSRFIINNEHHKSSTSSYNRGRTDRVYDKRPSTTGSSVSQRRPSYFARTPKVIVTTSTSIRDNNGRTINYSVSSSDPSAPSTTASSQPVARSKVVGAVRSYDEYKDDDVLTDPFFLDVPRVPGGGTGRSKRDTLTVRKRRKQFMFIVPRFM